MTAGSTASVRQLIETYFATIHGLDEDAVARTLQLFDDDIEWVLPESIKQGGTYRGKAAVAALLGAASGEVFQPGTYDGRIRSIVVEGDKAVALFDNRGITPAGRLHENHFAVEFEIRDGRIAYVREHFDTLLFQNVIYGDG